MRRRIACCVVAAGAGALLSVAPLVAGQAAAGSLSANSTSTTTIGGSSPSAAVPVQPVVIESPIRVDDSTPWYEGPYETLALGALLGGVGSWLVARNERKKAEAAHARSLTLARSEARAQQRMSRFEAELSILRAQDGDQVRTARSLRVLEVLLSAAQPPDQAISDLELRPESFSETSTAEAVERVAENLTRYGVCAPSDVVAERAQVRDAVATALGAVETTAAATRDKLRTMQTTGAKQAETEMRLLIEST